ncbi:hypothetical protein L208DRAFT_1553872 [Tricholoma matsutake]|nr:hypothetical protein L208DRAFT_1553872 [Tricholoma matsutake 945]
MSATTHSLLENPNFAGVLNAIEPKDGWEKPTPGEIEDDVDGEQEALGLPTNADDDHEQEADIAEDFQQLQSTLQDASKGVFENTHNEYTSQANHCVDFLIKQGLIMKWEEFLQETPHPQSPWFICAWIMNEYASDSSPLLADIVSFSSCDELQLDGTHHNSWNILPCPEDAGLNDLYLWSHLQSWITALAQE